MMPWTVSSWKAYYVRYIEIELDNLFFACPASTVRRRRLAAMLTAWQPGALPRAETSYGKFGCLVLCALCLCLCVCVFFFLFFSFSFSLSLPYEV